jgi:hypothetical protein
VPDNQSVFVMGTTTSPFAEGTGFISVEHTPGFKLFWSGVNSTTGGGVPTTTGGRSSTAGDDMAVIGADPLGATVTLQVADDSHFAVHNGTAIQVSGFVWVLSPPH